MAGEQYVRSWASAKNTGVVLTGSNSVADRSASTRNCAVQVVFRSVGGPNSGLSGNNELFSDTVSGNLKIICNINNGVLGLQTSAGFSFDPSNTNYMDEAYHTARLQMVGTTLQLFVDGAVILTRTHTPNLGANFQHRTNVASTLDGGGEPVSGFFHIDSIQWEEKPGMFFLPVNSWTFNSADLSPTVGSVSLVDAGAETAEFGTEPGGGATGDSAASAPVATASGAGTIQRTGSAASTVSAPEVSSDGTRSASGSSAAAPSPAQSLTDGVRGVSASSGAEASPASSQGTGVSTVTGSSASQVSPSSVSAGVRQVVGVSSAVAPGASVSSGAVRRVTGSAGSIAPLPELAAIGEGFQPFIASRSVAVRRSRSVSSTGAGRTVSS